MTETCLKWKRPSGAEAEWGPYTVQDRLGKKHFTYEKMWKLGGILEIC